MSNVKFFYDSGNFFSCFIWYGEIYFRHFLLCSGFDLEWGEDLAFKFEIKSGESVTFFVGGDLVTTVVKGFGKKELTEFVALGGA